MSHRRRLTCVTGSVNYDRACPFHIIGVIEPDTRRLKHPAISAHRPLRLALGLLLQPLLALGADYLARRITPAASARVTPANAPIRRRDALRVSGRAAASGQSSHCH